MKMTMKINRKEGESEDKKERKVREKENCWEINKKNQRIEKGIIEARKQEKWRENGN